MTKEEINKIIYELNSDDEIVNFVQKRIAELENKSSEITVGQNYTDSFRVYISSKVHFKPATTIGDNQCPDLVFDDIVPYINLIKKIRKGRWYNELTLLTTIFFTINDYLGRSDDIFERFMAYNSHIMEGKVSIREIKEHRCAFCSEISALAHNMFKFLGIDSEFVCGMRNNENHAFLLVYPNGYDNVPLCIYDPSFFVSFVKSENEKYSFGYYTGLNKENYESFKSGVPYKADLTKAEQTYRKLYGFNGLLDNCVFEGETPTYIYGIGYNYNRK